MNNTCNQKTFKELYRKIDKVTRIRYIAANRLKIHQKLSQWITTLLSVLLIIVPLLQALKVPIRSSEQFLNAVQVFLAVLVLAYSLLLGTENYSSRAENMESCGVELSFLAREIFPYIEADHDIYLYKIFSEKYQSILVKYKNHDPIDHKLYILEKIDIRLKKIYSLPILDYRIVRLITPIYLYFQDLLFFYLRWLIIKVYFFLGFWHYALVSLGSTAIIYYIFSKGIF